MSGNHLKAVEGAVEDVMEEAEAEEVAEEEEAEKFVLPRLTAGNHASVIIQMANGIPFHKINNKG